MRPALLAVLLLAGCATVPKPPSATYRAIGTEPFWSLELNGREMIFSEANTRHSVSEPQPRPIHGFAGDIYQGSPDQSQHRRGQRCSDGNERSHLPRPSPASG
jgi:uncharacterized membrane protein